MAHRARTARRRIVGTRSIQLRFLIVCEGTKTEPNYFEALISDNRLSSVIAVDIQGEGKGTVSLVRKTQKVVEESGLSYDRVWVVFDKDDFVDFDEAVALAEELGYGAAWSNESFELWYLLHFYCPTAKLNRKQYITRLERQLRARLENRNYRYRKGSLDMYSILCGFGSEGKACARAQTLRHVYRDCAPSEARPCTTVDLLVLELRHPERVPLRRHLRRE